MLLYQESSFYQKRFEFVDINVFENKIIPYISSPNILYVTI